MENAITALEVIEKIVPAIPVAGSYLTAIMGTVVLGLKAVKSLDDEKDKVYQLAMRTYKLAIAIDTATKDKWEILDGVIKSRLEEVKRTIDQIGDFFQQYEKRRSRWGRFTKKDVDSKAVTEFINALDEDLAHFNLIILTASHEALKQQALQLTSQAAQLASLHETFQVPTETDDNGLLVFNRAMLNPGGDADIKELFSMPHPSRLQARSCYSSSSTSSAEMITQFVQKGSKIYAVKKYTSNDHQEARKRFCAALEVRLKLESTDGLPKLIGTIGRKGNYPCQVLQLNSGKLHIPLGYLLDNYDPYTSNSFLIFALLQLKSTLTQWQLFFERRGCDFDRNEIREQEVWMEGRCAVVLPNWSQKEDYCHRLVDETLVEIDLSGGRRDFSLIYTGELERRTSELRMDTNRHIWNVCMSRMPYDIIRLPLRLQDSDMYASKFENVEPTTRLPGLAPLLLDASEWRDGKRLEVMPCQSVTSDMRSVTHLCFSAMSVTTWASQNGKCMTVIGRLGNCQKLGSTHLTCIRINVVLGSDGL